jgi:FkbM family methyltransferase
MISYAQNREDVVLARALPQPAGFYVDVGAADPYIASVTKYFYDLGWHGINLEPRPPALAKLEVERPRDVNLAVAVGSENGTTSFFVVEEDPDLSTMDEIDRDLLTDRGYSTSLHPVDVRTLNDILSEYEVVDIDFMKIDVEGSEAAVLEGLDLSRWRPRVVVVEAVEPYSHVRTDHLWRHLLEGAGYKEGCFDGINLFFAHSDDLAVLENLLPASPIDDFKTAHVSDLEHWAKSLEDELSRVTGYVRDLEFTLGINTEVAEAGARRLPPSVGGNDRPTRDAHSELRLAVLSTPCTGGPWLTRALEGVLEASGLSVPHPGEIPWDSLPSRVVVEVPWTRTRLLQKRLGELDFAAVSISRHPVETLLSIADLCGIGSSSALEPFGGDWPGVAEVPGPGLDEDKFLDWATSSAAHRLLWITPSWWNIPSTVRVRFEDLVRGAGEVCSTILDGCGWEGPRLPISPAMNGLATDLSRHGSGSLAQRFRTGDGSRRVYEAHRDVFEILGYEAQSAVSTIGTDQI